MEDEVKNTSAAAPEEAKEERAAPVEQEEKSEKQDKKKDKEKEKEKKKELKEIQELKEKLVKAETEAGETKDKYLRLAAEYDNYRKRTAKELDARFSDGFVSAVASILPIVDNVERAAASVENADQAVKDGMALIVRQTSEALAKMGVEVIDTAPGTAFDPNYCNAVMHTDGEGGENGEPVIDETFQKGYKRGDTVLRCAMVRTRG